MVGLRESWCFCKGVSKSERMKATIFSGKGQAMATISGASSGVGFLIHRNLLLTTHTNLPSAVAVDCSEIRLHNGVAATLVPQRFFITSSVLDLTIVGLDDADGESDGQSQYPHYLKTCCKTNLDLGSVVYLLGYNEKQELTVGEGKVVIATDNLIKLSTDGIQWNPGSAGFDVHGNLAFMICDPMKLATSPDTKSSSTSSSSSSSCTKDLPMQFGIPIPVICDWLNQHWEGTLDDLNKPKLPLIRLMSTGSKSEHSCASFTLRQVFKSTDTGNAATPSSSNCVSKGQSSSAVTNIVEEQSLMIKPQVLKSTDTGNAATPSSSNTVSKGQSSSAVTNIFEEQSLMIKPQVFKSTDTGNAATPSSSNCVSKGQSSSAVTNIVEEQSLIINPNAAHVQGIPTPEIYESPRINAVPLRKKENTQIQLLDINFPPRIVQPEVLPQPSKILHPKSAENFVEGPLPENRLGEQNQDRKLATPSEEVASTLSVNVAENDVQFCSSPMEVSEMHNEYSSEGETMYSAETAESRNYTTPKEVKFQQVGRSQSCVRYNRWGTAQRNQGSHGKKMYSQEATSQRSNDYYNPTVSSIMKRNPEHTIRLRQTPVHSSSPKWMF